MFERFVAAWRVLRGEWEARAPEPVVNVAWTGKWTSEHGWMPVQLDSPLVYSNSGPWGPPRSVWGRTG